MKKIRIDVRSRMDLEVHPDAPKTHVKKIVRRELLREFRKEVSRQLNKEL